jgi:DNA polymerase III sliding clamp (beta) subunit (PCNA family)
MQINKQELMDAVSKAAKFKAKSGAFRALTAVLIDGENQRVVATDHDAYAVVDLEMRETETTIAPEKKTVEMPGEEFAGDLDEMLKAQLESLCEYAGVTVPGKNPTKDDYVVAVFEASVKSAMTEAAQPVKTVQIHEKILVDPVRLMKVVQSLDTPEKNSPVTLTPEDYSWSEYGAWVPGFLSVGENFKALKLEKWVDFPDLSDELVGYEKKWVLSVPGNKIGAGCVHAVASDDHRLHVNTTFFDGDNGKIVSTDGKRLHALSIPPGVMGPAKFYTRHLKSVATLAKTEEVSFHEIASDNGFWKWNMTTWKDAGMQVYLRDVNHDGEFPPYQELFQATEETRTCKVAAGNLKKAATQALALADASYHTLKMHFNGGVNTLLEHESAGTFDRQNLPYYGETPDDMDIQVALDVNFIRDVCRMFENDEPVGISLVDESHPVVFTNQREDFQAVVMPMWT